VGSDREVQNSTRGKKVKKVSKKLSVGGDWRQKPSWLVREAEDELSCKVAAG